MKLTYFLKDVILERTQSKLLVEISQKKKDDLVAKFSAETNDSLSAITNNINSFEKYQQGLPIDKRDLDKYSYSELKKLIESKQFRKVFEDAFTFIKKNNENVNDKTLSKNIKKFFEIKSELPKERQDIKKYTYLSLDKLINDNYEGLLYKKYVPIFKQEEPQTNDATFKAYLENYVENYDNIPIKTKPINYFTFIELEHMLDAMAATKSVGKEKRVTDYSDVDMIYNENNEAIVRLKTKEQCIKYKRGRGWCITWEGSNNRYYYYRLDKKRTIYYAIDDSLPYEDTNHILVILVEPDGTKFCADKTNSGRFAGDTRMSWEEIVGKQPKLEGLEHLFVPVPLTNEEKELISQVRNKQVGDNPAEAFSTPEMLELWVEMLQQNLTDVQYSNLTPELKRKYIASGFKLSANMIANSEANVLSYYSKKETDALLDKRLSSLTNEDIVLLNTPIMKRIKDQLKPRFSTSFNLNSDVVKITYPSNDVSKYIALYGIESLFDEIPETITEFKFYNTSNSPLDLDLTKIGKFKDLEILGFKNAVNIVPNEIMQLENLSTLILEDCPNVTKIPPIENLPYLFFVNLSGSKNIKLTPSFIESFEEFSVEPGVYSKKSID